MIKTINPWLYPNKPFEIFYEELKRIDKYESGNWISTLKYDGYRAVVSFDDDITIMSRRDKAKGGPARHPASDIILDAAKQFQEENNLPLGTRLDGEWTSLRKASYKYEKLYIFGIYYLGDEYLGKKPESFRFNLVKNLKYNSEILLVDSVENNYVDFYQKSMENPHLEGIVLKHKDSILITNRSKCEENPFWLKCRWRAGDDGATLRDDSILTLGE